MDYMESSQIVDVLQECLMKVKIINNLTDLECDRLKEQKKELENVLQLTIEEIQDSGTFPTIKDIIANFMAQELAKEAKINTDLADTRKKSHQRTPRVLNASVLKLIASNKEKHETDLELANLKDDREEEITTRDIQVNYYTKWYQAKAEQNKYLLNMRETQHQQNIMAAIRDNETEHRIANEIINFLRKSIQDLNDQLEWWKDKYANDLEQNDLILNTVTFERNKQLEKLGEWKLMYEERTKEMEEFESMKAELQKQKDLELYENSMATRIQAWWRGVMVRRHLGPYKDQGRKPKAKIVKAKK